MSLKFVLAISLFCYVYLAPIYCQSQEFDDYKFREAKERDKLRVPVPLPTSRPTGRPQNTPSYPYQKPDDSENMSDGSVNALSDGSQSNQAQARGPSGDAGRLPLLSINPGASQTTNLLSTGSQPSEIHYELSSAAEAESANNQVNNQRNPSQYGGDLPEREGYSHSKPQTSWQQQNGLQNRPQLRPLVYHPRLPLPHKSIFGPYKKQQRKPLVKFNNCMLHQKILSCK